MSATAANEQTFAFAWNDASHSNRVLRVVADEREEGAGLGARDEHATAAAAQDAAANANDAQGAAANVDQSESKADVSVDASVVDTRTREYNVMSALLTKHSAYFRALFSNDAASASASRVVEIHVPASRDYAEAMESLLRAMYTNELESTMESGKLLALLVLCDRFQVPAVARLAVDALMRLKEQQFTLQFIDALLTRFSSVPGESAVPTSTLKTELAPDRCCSKLAARFSPLQDHGQWAEWRQLSPAAMAALLHCSALVADKEETVWCALTHWWRPRVGHVTPNMAAHLLAGIRYPQKAEEFLTDRVRGSWLYAQYMAKMEPWLWDAVRFTLTEDWDLTQDSTLPPQAFEPRPNEYYPKKEQEDDEEGMEEEEAEKPFEKTKKKAAMETKKKWAPAMAEEDEDEDMEEEEEEENEKKKKAAVHVVAEEDDDEDEEED